jgi:hypothetical protein
MFLVVFSKVNPQLFLGGDSYRVAIAGKNEALRVAGAVPLHVEVFALHYLVGIGKREI